MTRDPLEIAGDLERAANNGCEAVTFRGAALDELREAAACIRELQGIIAQHDLCHDLHGKVDARAFADGCAAEQRRIYGCAPDADAVSGLSMRVAELERHSGESMRLGPSREGDS